MRRIVSGLVFVSIALSLWGGMHYYVFARLARDPQLPGALQALVAAALWTLGVGTFVAMLRLLPKKMAAPLWTLAFTWMGALFLLDVALAAGDLVRLALGAGGILREAAPLAVARVQAAGSFLLGLAVAFLAWRRAAGEVPVREVEVVLPKLPPELSGFSIVQVSDLHVSPDTDRRRIERIVARVNALGADLIALTGDLVDGSPELLHERALPLASLRARHGAFFVTGNHEYYSGADRWLETFRSFGFRTLQNERVQVGEGAALLEIAGVPDWRAGSFGAHHVPRLGDTVAGRDSTKPLILLAHQPRQFPEAAKLGVDLQLSGHTHGGQIWPFTLLVKMAEPYLAGLHREGDAQLYVSRGTGYWGPPMRLAAPQEITRIVLKSGPAAT